MKLMATILFILSACQTALADHSGDMGHSHHSGVEKSIKVAIGDKGFHPESPLIFKSNETIVLNVTRTTKKTCMTSLKHPKSGKLVELPLNKEVRFEVGTYSESKKIDLLCGMDMKAGMIEVKGNKPKKG